jgi:L-alanine-DL-glutamate epimerase-like enolase superfamily enzyme
MTTPMGPRVRHHRCVEDHRPQVSKLVAPRWPDGGGSLRERETSIGSPARRDVEQALRHLDGKEFNDLYLRTSDAETYLGICGGAGRYMVAICDHNEQFGQLLNTQDPSDVEEHIMCGGQLTRFSRRHLVDLQTALTAAVHYLATAEAAPTLSWEWYR